MLIGTAGHVNHGKTSLIRALTGIDTDRLPEEKRRGLTIDLGYAYTERPDGRIVGFVDVPGHDHYLHNMIAGVLPLDCVLLVVAADEGPARQTQEHLEILDLIGTRRLVVAITKIDRSDEMAIAQTQGRLRDVLSRTSFSDAAFFPVSSEKHEGLDALQHHLDTLDAEKASIGAGFRLPIDRAFTLSGIGTVVTGTVLSGNVDVGDKVVLTPSGVAARVRSLHAQNRPAHSASAGVRCAVAIFGPHVDKDKIKRGQLLVAPTLHRPSEKIGASLKLAPGLSLRGDRNLQLYHGAGRTPVRLRIIDEDAVTKKWLVELTPDRPLAVLQGDRVLLRDESTKTNIAGGIVVDPFAPTRKNAREERAAVLRASAHPDHAEAVAALLDAAGVVDFKKFCLARNLGAADVKALAAGFEDDLRGDIIPSKSIRERLKSRLMEGLAQYHRQRPQCLGPRKEEVLAFVGRQFAVIAIIACLNEMMVEGIVIQDGACIRLESHRPHLAVEDQRIWDKVQTILESAGLRPPHTGGLAEDLRLEWKEMESALLRIVQFGLLIRVARNRFFLPHTINRLRDIATGLVHEQGSFTAAEFNEKSAVGRNLTIELLEYFDAIGATKRDGLHRRLP
jgi:selenocysteine-specific elongation factor